MLYASPAQCLLDRLKANKTLLQQQNINFQVNQSATLVTIAYSFSGKNLYEQGFYYSNPFGMRMYKLTSLGQTISSWPQYCGCSQFNESTSGPGLDIKTAGVCDKF